MSKFKFVKISKNKKIRYLINNTSGDIYVVFLHGFKSDLEGDKPKACLFTDGSSVASRIRASRPARVSSDFRPEVSACIPNWPWTGRNSI